MFPLKDRLLSYKTRFFLTAWLIGLCTGAGIVLAWQVGDWQYKLVEVWHKWTS